MRLNSRLSVARSRSVLVVIASMVVLWLTWWWAASQSWLLRAGLQNDPQAAAKSLPTSKMTVILIVTAVFLLTMVCGFAALVTLSTDEAFSMTKATLAASMFLFVTILVSSVLSAIQPAADQVALAAAHPILLGQAVLFEVVLSFGIVSLLVFAWKYVRHDPSTDLDDWE